MTYQEALTQEINSLLPAFLPEVLDFVLFLKIKARTPADHLTQKISDMDLPVSDWGRMEQEIEEGYLK